MNRRKHTRTLQLQELNSMMATRKRKPRMTWKEFFQTNPELAERAKSQRIDHEQDTDEYADDILDREDWQRGAW